MWKKISELLSPYNTNPDDVLSRFVTDDETWIHQYDPNTRQESMQWKHVHFPPPKKFRTQSSAGKVMTTIL